MAQGNFFYLGLVPKIRGFIGNTRGMPGPLHAVLKLLPFSG
jgi:hypothetical protein